MTVRMTCWSESMLIREWTHQKGCSSKSVLIREHAHQRVCSSEIVLIRESALQRLGSSESLLIRDHVYQVMQVGASEYFVLLPKAGRKNWPVGRECAQKHFSHTSPERCWLSQEASWSSWIPLRLDSLSSLWLWPIYLYQKHVHSASF